MKHLIKPKHFGPSKFKVGDKVWIIEDELQDSGEYIDKVKEATILKIESYWFKWWLIKFWIFNKSIKLIPTYEQLDSYILKTDTLRRSQSDDFEIFATEKEANEWFNKNYAHHEDGVSN